MENNIKCSVHDCLYWDNGSCSADGIEVMVSDGSQIAGSELKTACKTYVNQRPE